MIQVFAGAGNIYSSQRVEAVALPILIGAAGLIASIVVKRRGDVRRAKLYYLRQRSGKSARIKEKLA